MVTKTIKRFFRSRWNYESSVWCSKCFSTNTLRLNICYVVLLRDLRPVCSCSKICSARPTSMLNSTRNMTSLGRLTNQANRSVILTEWCVAFFRKSDDQRLCPVFGSLSTGPSRFSDISTVKAPMTPGRHILESQAGCYWCCFKILCSFFEILPSVFNL